MPLYVRLAVRIFSIVFGESVPSHLDLVNISLNSPVMSESYSLSRWSFNLLVRIRQMSLRHQLLGSILSTQCVPLVLILFVWHQMVPERPSKTQHTRQPWFAMVSSYCDVRFHGSTTRFQPTLDVSRASHVATAVVDLAGQSRAIQCNLPINLFNELVFVIVWGWLVFLTGLTGVSLLFYTISTVAKFDRKFVRIYLKMNTTHVPKKADRERFVMDYLRYDGILVLRILAQNTNDVIMAKLVGALFQLYSESWPQSDDGNEADYQTGQTFIWCPEVLFVTVVGQNLLNEIVLLILFSRKIKFLVHLTKLGTYSCSRVSISLPMK